jgi:hypothetical protein
LDTLFCYNTLSEKTVRDMELAATTSLLQKQSPSRFAFERRSSGMSEPSPYLAEARDMELATT